jgi:hypothetical protein
MEDFKKRRAKNQGERIAVLFILGFDVQAPVASDDNLAS